MLRDLADDAAADAGALAALDAGALEALEPGTTLDSTVWVRCASLAYKSTFHEKKSLTLAAVTMVALWDGMKMEESNRGQQY